MLIYRPKQKISTTASEEVKFPASSIDGLATVATSGSYNDLTDKPEAPGIPDIVQTTGTSTTAVMSQKAVTDELNKKANSADLAQVATSGNYNDLSNKPTIPAAANNGTLTIQKNGTNVATFGANQSTNTTANITVPVKVSELTNDSGYTTNEGTITGINMNGASKGTSGVVDLGTVLTDASAFATSAQGTKADNAMPKSGGTFTGDVTISSGYSLNTNLIKSADDTKRIAEITEAGLEIGGSGTPLRLYSSTRPIHANANKELAYTSDIPTDYVPNTRKVNNKALSSDITLDASDVRALPTAGGTVTGNLTVGGNLTINGTTTTVDSTTLQVKDKLIEVAHGNTTTLTTPAGLVAPKYDGTNSGALVFDSTGTAYVGDITLKDGNIDVANSGLQPLATRTGLVGGNLVQYDSSALTLKDSGKKIGDLALKTDIPTNYVTTDTTQNNISGKKTFTNTIVKKSSAIDLNKKPTTGTQWNYIEFTDKNDDRIGVAGSRFDAGGYAGVYLQARNSQQLWIASSTPDSNGNTVTKTSTPTPPATDDSTQIANTAWVRTNYQEKGYAGIDGAVVNSDGKVTDKDGNVVDALYFKVASLTTSKAYLRTYLLAEVAMTNIVKEQATVLIRCTTESSTSAPNVTITLDNYSYASLLLPKNIFVTADYKSGTAGATFTVWVKQDKDFMQQVWNVLSQNTRNYTTTSKREWSVFYSNITKATAVTDIDTAPTGYTRIVANNNNRYSNLEENTYLWQQSQNAGITWKRYSDNTTRGVFRHHDDGTTETFVAQSDGFLFRPLNNNNTKSIKVDPKTGVLYPEQNSGADLGKTAQRWNAVYAGNTGVRSTGNIICDSKVISYSAVESNNEVPNFNGILKDDLYTTTPTKTRGAQYLARDKNGAYIGGLRVYHDTNGAIQAQLMCRSQNTEKQKNVALVASKDSTGVAGDWRFVPNDNAVIDLGTSGQRWAKTYTKRLNLSSSIAVDDAGNVVQDASNGISFAGTKSTTSMIRFANNDANTYGNGIVIGGGGVVIMGCGESADALYSALVKNQINAGKTAAAANTEVAQSENTYITSDNNIRLLSNCNNIANRKELAFSSSGQLVYTPTAGGTAYAYTLPTESGKLATTSDINNGTLTIQRNGYSAGSFSANQSTDVNIDITVPEKLSELENDAKFIYNNTDNSGSWAFGGGGNTIVANSTANNCVAIGTGSQTRYQKSIRIGTALGQTPKDQSVTQIGVNNYTSSGRALYLGAGYTGFTYMNAAGSSWTSASDIRDKTDIQTIDHALDFIKKLKPITYVMNDRERYLIRDENDNPILDENGKQQYDVEAHKRGDKKKHRRFAGLSAQDTYQAMLDCYNNDTNYAQIVDNNKFDHPDDEYLEQYSMSYERLVPFLIKAIQEQQEQIDKLKSKLGE